MYYLHTQTHMFFYICKYTDIHLHIALSSPRFNMYNRDIFIQETYYGGNSRLFNKFFICKTVCENTLYRVGAHDYPCWLYHSKWITFGKVMLVTGTNKFPISMGPLWPRSSPASWRYSFPSLGFCFFLFNLRMLYEMAPDSLLVITCFGFSFWQFLTGQPALQQL